MSNNSQCPLRTRALPRTASCVPDSATLLGCARSRRRQKNLAHVLRNRPPSTVLVGETPLFSLFVVAKKSKHCCDVCVRGGLECDGCVGALDSRTLVRLGPHQPNVCLSASVASGFCSAAFSFCFISVLYLCFMSACLVSVCLCIFYRCVPLYVCFVCVANVCLAGM